MSKVNCNTINLGTVKANFKNGIIAGEKLVLQKHQWDCGWYWGFGYIGNKNLHTHFNIELLHNINFSEIWKETPFKDQEWYVILDLFKQAYGLKEAAEIYRHGGYIASQPELTSMIIDKDQENRINKDLKIVLDALWNYMENCINDKLEVYYN